MEHKSRGGGGVGEIFQTKMEGNGYFRKEFPKKNRERDEVFHKGEMSTK